MAFFGEVSSSGMLGVVSYLPTVDGFRKNSAPGIEKRKLALTNILVRERTPSPLARQYLALYGIWRQWAVEHLGEPAGIDTLLSAVEEASGASDGDETGQSEAVNKAIDDLFSTLREWSLADKCSREAIERFFKFSPFSESPELRKHIDGAKPAADIERDVAFSGLPQRLRHDEDEIKSLDQKVRTLSERIEHIGGEATEYRRELSELRRTASQPNSKQLEIQATLDGQMASLKEVGKGLAEVGREVGALREHIEGQLKLLSESIRTVSGASEQLSSTMASRDQLNELERRLSLLEQAEEERLTAPAVEPLPEPPARIEEKVVIHDGPTIRAQKLSAHQDGKPLTSVDGASVAVATGLQALGLRKSASEVFALELCAACFTGQVVFLKGALAVSVARTCACVMGGQSAYRISVPIGLNDGEVLRTAMSNATIGTGDPISSVAIEGLNRSALDVFADALLDIVDANAASNGPVLTVFVSLVQGVAALPIEAAYLQLGPVFDLDLLDWQYRRPKQTAVVSNGMSKSAYNAIFDKLSSVSADNDEPLRLLRKFSARRNPRIERTLLAAFAALTHLRGSKANPSHLQSLAYGWLVPLWASWDLSREEVDSELDAGKCDASAVDPRLAAALSSGEFRSRGNSGES